MLFKYQIQVEEVRRVVDELVEQHRLIFVGFSQTTEMSVMR